MLPNKVLFSNLPPLALYIHIPWCIKKCPYCDFNSHSVKNTIPEEKYIECLIADLEGFLPQIWGRQIDSIFIGGGTPSLFSGDSINKLLDNIRSRINLSPFAEITMEINPGTVEVIFLKDYALAGINRISFGIQSFNDKHLQVLGRIHNSLDAKNAIQTAKTIFDNINLDIIYGLPNQTINEVIEDITLAVSFYPKHLSCYNLTIEPNTYFYKNLPHNLPDNDLCYLMQEAIISKLADCGYNRYEISAFAKNGFRCKHNLNYWSYGDYIGIGAGAHSKVSFLNKIIREARQKNPKLYMDSIDIRKHVIESYSVEVKNIPFEYAMNTFRLIDGMEVSLFTERTGLPFNTLLPHLLKAQEMQFLLLDKGKITLTKRGHDFLNELLMIFLDD